MSSTQNKTVAVSAGKETYEGKIAVEGLSRVGKNPNIKGVVHELLYRDKLNLKPTNLITGKRACLTRSVTAVRDDVIIKRTGQVVGRNQLKDTASAVSKTIKQVSNGKYARTTLVGTKETTKAFNKAAARRQISQRMKSSGISSVDTTRIGCKALGKLPKGKILAISASKAGAAGLVIGAGIEAVSAGKELKNGFITKREFAGRVASEGVNGAATAAASTAVASAATAGTAAALGALGLASAPAWVPVTVGVGAAVATGVFVSKGFKLIFKRFRR